MKQADLIVLAAAAALAYLVMPSIVLAVQRRQFDAAHGDGMRFGPDAGVWDASYQQQLSPVQSLFT